MISQQGRAHTSGIQMDRTWLEANVMLELEALKQRMPLLSDRQLSELMALLRSVVPGSGTPMLM